jgi:cytidylate kinase
MNSTIEVERCLSFIKTQLRNDRLKKRLEGESHIRAVTISRQAGCGAFAVAEELAKRLQTQGPGDEPWTVFDKNLVGKVLEEHNLPQRLARFMPEGWSSEFENTIDELCGLHPSAWILVRQTAETILGLAKLGNVIIIGRGANIITAKLTSVFHVRLVASLESRVRRIQENDQLGRKAALEFIECEDRGRKRYLRKHYHKDINDPLLYHVLINTDLICYERAAQMIGEMVSNGYGVSRLSQAHH